MDYQEFMACLMTGLQEIYGKDAVISTKKVLKNNGQHYNGLQIIVNGGEKAAPVINTDEIYDAYGKGSMNMEDCVKEICKLREEYDCPEEIRQFAASLLDWEAVREKVYPVLLSTEENRELLQELVSMPMLDLSTIYMIRRKASDGSGNCVKIRKPMLERYGIDVQELHKTAVENMGKDGYRFQDMECLLREMLCSMGWKGDTPPCGDAGWNKMYVLTNSVKLYGAAGVLDKSLIQEFAGNRSFFILPSSVHETIFVPADDRYDKEELDKMVAEINELQVAEEERLVDHCYFYDGKTCEIRMRP